MDPLADVEGTLRGRVSTLGPAVGPQAPKMKAVKAKASNPSKANAAETAPEKTGSSAAWDVGASGCTKLAGNPQGLFTWTWVFSPAYVFCF